MGAVYKAVQLSLDRPVAIKILPREFGEDESFRANFKAEAKAMARLNHPNLISVYDFGEVAGMLFIIMEFVPGQTLYHSAHGIAIAPEAAARIVVGICLGLADAHEHGVLHRDIKPGNILLDQQARPKIGDFGLARPIGAAVKVGETIFGTPHYTAPEVLQHPQRVDARADIFSVGVVLHELLTGRLPASDLRPASVICGCDARFDAIIRRATHMVPEQRYASAADMARDLRAITQVAAAPAAAKVGKAVQGAKAVRRPGTPIATRVPGAGRRPVAEDASGKIALLVLLGVALVVLAVFLLVPTKTVPADKPATAPVSHVASSPPIPSQPPPVAIEPKPVITPKPPSVNIEPKPKPPPEPEVAIVEPVTPEPEPVIPAPAPAPVYNVAAFLDRARDVMRQKAAPIFTASAKEIEKNYDTYEHQIIYKLHQLDKDKQGGVKAKVDKSFEKWRAAGRRVPKVLDLIEAKTDKPAPPRGRGARGNPDQEKEFYEKVVTIHTKFLAKQDKLDHELEADLLELASSYVLGISKQIERLTNPNDAPAVASLRAEVNATQDRPLYFTDLMRGIDPDAPKAPPADAKGAAPGAAPPADGKGAAPTPGAAPAPAPVPAPVPGPFDGKG